MHNLISMSRFLPEILREIFYYLQPLPNNVSLTLDLLAASLVCTAWYSEARILLNRGASRSLPLLNYGKKSGWIELYHINYLKRLLSLLQESRRLGLDHSNLVEEIDFQLYHVTEKVQEGVDIISSILSLELPNLHAINFRFTYSNSGYFGSGMIGVFDQVCPLVTTITKLVIGPVQPQTWASLMTPQPDQRALVRLVELLQGTLCHVSLYGVCIDESMQLALSGCRDIECLVVQAGFFLPPSDPSKIVIRIAAALPRLKSLTFHPHDHEAKVSSAAAGEIIAARPGLMALSLWADKIIDA